MIVIYALVCPHTDSIRYIGKTAQKLQRRLNAHISDALRNQHSHKQRWIKKCLDSGARPRIQVLEEISANESWQDCERRLIQSARESGADLTNQTAGGEGMNFIDPEAEAKYRLSQSAASKKTYYENAGAREAFRAGELRSWKENREGRLAALMSGWTEQAKSRHAEIMNGLRATPEFKAAKSKASRKMWTNASHRAAFMEAFAKPETKAKQSERKRRSWSDPKARTRMMNRWTPEARALQSQRIRDRQALIQSKMTPEIRAKQAATLKETWAKRKAAMK